MREQAGPEKSAIITKNPIKFLCILNLSSSADNSSAIPMRHNSAGPSSVDLNHLEAGKQLFLLLRGFFEHKKRVFGSLIYARFFDADIR